MKTQSMKSSLAGRLFLAFSIAFGPLAVFACFFILALGLYDLGGCRGAMGSGITCERGDAFGFLAYLAEISLIGGFAMLPILWFFVAGIPALAYGVFAIVKASRRRSNSRACSLRPGSGGQVRGSFPG
jgi:hypothetical protein